MRAHRNALIAALVCAMALANLACGDSPADTLNETPSRSSLIRLADRLHSASISSPLVDVPAVTSLEQLGNIPRDVVFMEDFEAIAPEAEGSDTPSLGTVVETEAGHALRMSAQTMKGVRSWTVPVQPKTHYVFERRARSTVPIVADLTVVEIPELMSFEQLTTAVGRDQALSKTHQLDAPLPDGSWQDASVAFSSMPNTKAVLILLRKTPGDAARGTLSKEGDAEAWFDDIRLTRLDPTPEHSIGFLKAQDLAEDADPALGMRKRGQFPPLLPGGSQVKSLEDNYSVRNALYAPPPTALGFPLTLGPSATLGFSYCLARQTQAGSSAEFAVLAECEGEQDVLWSETLTARPSEWSWHEAQIDLSAYADRPFTLTLRTSSETRDTHPMWGTPMIGQRPPDEAAQTVILIAVDTLRADRLSSYGYSRNTSPQLDALAADGVRFDQVVSNSTWTCPSFASILTGLVPSQHGVWVAGSLWARLPERFETLAERFRAHGWSTQSIAYKAPLYNSGYDQGFDVSFIAPQEVTHADENLGKAMEWLDSRTGLQNFLFLHFNDPHQPFTQPAPFDNAFGPVSEWLELPYYIGKPPVSEKTRQFAKNMYDGEVAYVDDRIGALLDELKQRDLYDSATIVFVSDHGEAFWEHGSFGHSLGKLYDEGIRVPLIVKPANSGAARGKVVKTQVRAFDVMPTLLELAGLPVPNDIHAESLAPLLAADTADAPDRLAVTETHNGGLALRTQDWKYISKSWRRPRSTESLFDLRADPEEQVNVAESNADVLKAMRTQILDYVMLHRPGHYMVVIGTSPGMHYAFHVRGVDSAVSIHGLTGEVDEDGSASFQGDSTDDLVLVARLTTTGPIGVGSSKPVSRQFTRYEPGQLKRLLQSGRAGLHLFDGPAEEADVDRGAPSMDAHQLDALRALGYLGGDESDGAQR